MIVRLITVRFIDMLGAAVPLWCDGCLCFTMTSIRRVEASLEMCSCLSKSIPKCFCAYLCVCVYFCVVLCFYVFLCGSVGICMYLCVSVCLFLYLYVSLDVFTCSAPCLPLIILPFVSS